MQKRFINYKASVDSFPLGEQHVGIFKPGRFNGFDVMETLDNISLVFTHSGKIVKADPEGNGIAVYGVVITPTGTVIHQEGPIQLNLPPNNRPPSTQPQFRTFILVCEHNYQAVKGGVQASYFLVANPEGSEEPLELPDNRSQVILGVVTKNYLTGGLSYKKSLTPLLGDQSARDIYELVKPFIIIPEPEEFPDIGVIVRSYITANLPKTIITPTFDLASGAGTLNVWSELPYQEFIIDTSGHNITNHTVRWKRVRNGDHKDFIDIEIAATSIKTGEGNWEWGNIRIIHCGFMNDQNKGTFSYAPYELRGSFISDGAASGTVRYKRIAIHESSGGDQAVSIKLVVQNISTIGAMPTLPTLPPGDGFDIIS